jgi:hypothetical protein
LDVVGFIVVGLDVVGFIVLFVGPGVGCFVGLEVGGLVGAGGVDGVLVVGGGHVKFICVDFS